MNLGFVFSGTHCTTTWDVTDVLNYLRTLIPNDKISLEQLSHKLVMLIALVSSQRAQTIAYIVTQDSTVSKSSVSFSVNHITKTSRPGKPTTIKLSAYSDGDRICVLQNLREYLRRTAPFSFSFMEDTKLVSQAYEHVS